MTSNLGSQMLLEGIDENGEIKEGAKEAVENTLKQHFRPEFLNRIDEIVFYKPLTKDEIKEIVDLLILDLQKRLDDKQLYISLSEEAKAYVVDQGYDALYGARPLKRFLQRNVETLIGRILIAQDIQPHSTLAINYKQDQGLFVETLMA